MVAVLGVRIPYDCALRPITIVGAAFSGSRWSTWSLFGEVEVLVDGEMRRGKPTQNARVLKTSGLPRPDVGFGKVMRIPDPESIPESRTFRLRNIDEILACHPQAVTSPGTLLREIQAQLRFFGGIGFGGLEQLQAAERFARALANPTYSVKVVERTFPESLPSPTNWLRPPTAPT